MISCEPYTILIINDTYHEALSQGNPGKGGGRDGRFSSRIFDMADCTDTHPIIPAGGVNIYSSNYTSNNNTSNNNQGNIASTSIL